MNTTPRIPARAGRCATGLAVVFSLLLGGCAMVPETPRAEAAQGTEEQGLDNQPAYLSLVRQMQGNGMWFASLAHIDALEQRWGVSTTTRLLRAEALRLTGQEERSTALYKQLLTSPERAAAYRGLGLLAGARNDYVLAAELFESARELQPADGLLLNDLGYALLMSTRFDRARLPIMQAAQLLPEHPRVRSNLALYLFTQGQTDSARQVMDEARLSEATRSAIEQRAQGLAPARHASLHAQTGALSNGLRLSPTLANPPSVSPP